MKLSITDRSARCLTFHTSRLTNCVLRAANAIALGLCFPLAAADLDPSKLPPPATTKIDFDHNIKPIFEKSCLRCHGPEKPKSKFRLDNKEDALKGGEENGSRDIIPGNSAQSFLIYYVARLIPEME